MKKILCALLILSMLIIPAACQRTDAPQGDKSATENGTVAPGWTPGGSEDDDSAEQGEPVESGEENGGENGFVPDSPVPVEIPTVTEAVPDKEVKSISIKTEPKTTVYYAGSPIDTTGLTLNVKFKDGTQKAIAGGFGYSPTVATQGVKKVTVSYGGKTDSFSIKVKDDALKDISIKSKPNRLNYAAKEKIDTTGLVINAQYESGAVRAVSSGFTISPDSFNSVGTHNVTVSYGGKTATFPVNVQSGRTALISTIRVSSKPNRISYYLNEKLDTKGMVVTVNYADGTSEDITEGFKCSPVNLNEKGVQKIIVTYENKSTAFNVTVKEDTVKSVEIKQGPKKVNYYQGDVLETEGLELTVDYENSPSKTITSGFACSPTLLKDAGLQTITVSYAGWKRTFTVRVKEDTLQSLELITAPVKRTYYVGESLDTKGMSLRAAYLSGRVKTVTDGYTCSPSVFSSAGTTQVAVGYGGLTAHFSVKVVENPIKELTASLNQPSKHYTFGSTINKSDLTVKVKYENGKTETITGYTISPQKLTSTGENHVQISYGDFKTYITVIVDDAITGITAKSSKTDYKVGEYIDKKEITVIATYASGNSTELPGGSYYCSPSSCPGEGEQIVTVFYKDNPAINDTFKVNVSK